jgi:hypothetical protein
MKVGDTLRTSKPTQAPAFIIYLSLLAFAHDLFDCLLSSVSKSASSHDDKGELKNSVSPFINDESDKCFVLDSVSRCSRVVLPRLI